MYCPKCGSPVKDGHRFCVACGFDLEKRKSAASSPNTPSAPGQQPAKQPSKQPSQAQPQEPRPQRRPARKKKKGMSLGLLIGLIAAGVLLIGGLAALFLLHPWRSDEDLGERDDRRSSASDRWDDEDEDERKKETAAEPSEAPIPVEIEAEIPVREYSITVWASDSVVDLTRKQIDDFNRTNEFGVRFNVTVEGMGEADASTRMIADADSGADLFCFPSDQLARLIQAGALSPVPGDRVSVVRTANDEGSVAAATLGETLHAYPMTADNGFFMYYDKSVIPEADVDSLEKIIQDCEKANRTFAFEVTTSAWYGASWFFATGCVSEWATDRDGRFISVQDTFNSPQGLIAARGMKKLLDSKCYLSASSAGEFANGAAVVISGTWNYDYARSVLGDNLGAADMPSFTVDGQTYHLGSYSGSKLMGVKPQADKDRTQALHRLAEYLTGERCQTERFAYTSWGPSNRNAQQSPDVQANPALAALLKQNQYAHPLGQIHPAWWNMATELTQNIQAAKNDGDLQRALNAYYYSLCALFDLPQGENDTWGVIGSICGTMWDKDFPMTETEPGVWRSELLTLHKGEEFKVRQNQSWDMNFGADGERDGANLVVEKDGKYYVWFNSATGKIWLE